MLLGMILAAQVVITSAVGQACPTVYVVGHAGPNDGQVEVSPGDGSKIFLFMEDALEYAQEYLPPHEPAPNRGVHCVDDPVTISITAREGTHDELIELEWCDADPCEKGYVCSTACAQDIHRETEDGLRLRLRLNDARHQEADECEVDPCQKGPVCAQVCEESKDCGP